MNQLMKMIARSHKASDLIGVMRGLARVGGQIVRRLDHVSEDGVYLIKNGEKQIDMLKKKMSDTQVFFETADNIMKSTEDQEFVTFDKPVFEYKKKEDGQTKNMMDRHYGGNIDQESSCGNSRNDDTNDNEIKNGYSDVIHFVPKSKVSQDTLYSDTQKPIHDITESSTKNTKSNEKINVETTQHTQKGKKKPAYNFEDYRKKKESDFSQIIEKKVPSNSFSRAFEFTKVGSSILGSAVGGLVMNSLTFGESKSIKDFAITEANAEKLAQALCKMRGAALKLGQALSMQEDQFLPEPIKKAFKKARQSANIMPKWQLEKIMVEEFGSNWLSDNFTSFDTRPFAAASIGQVHKAVLKDGRRVVLKVQYPGVANSIDSDLDNLKRLMDYTGVFPKTMFLDDFINNTRVELKDECDYKLEAAKQMKYYELSKSLSNVGVPRVIEELSSSNILTMEEIEGVDLETCAKELSQEERNFIGAKVMEVTLREIFDWRFMQTDPNFGNFFYNPDTEVLYLLDFGAAREYDMKFCKNYLDTVWGASNNDPALIYKATKELGFLSGEESEVMKAAHVESILIVGQPFAKQGLFDFGNQKMTKEIYDLMPVMLKNRLKSPPPEVYSLHRKLSGSYLINIHLKSSIPSRQIFMKIYNEVKCRNNES